MAVYSQLRRAIEETIAIEPHNSRVNLQSVQEIFNKMFEIHMTDYLQQEAEWSREVLERLCAQRAPPAPSSDAATLKRNVLGSLRDALLLPVSVVPKTVAYSFNALSTVGAGALQTMTGALISPSMAGPLPSPLTKGGYTDGQFLVDGHVRGDELESWLDEEDEPEPVDRNIPNPHKAADENEPAADDLRSLLSLDIALKLIAADRDALKRVESFESFTGFYGRKVRDTLEEIFIHLLQTLTQKHIKPAFERYFLSLFFSFFRGYPSTTIILSVSLHRLIETDACVQLIRQSDAPHRFPHPQSYSQEPQSR